MPCLPKFSLCPACPADFSETDPSRPADYFEKPHDENLTMLCIVGIKVGGWVGGCWPLQGAEQAGSKLESGRCCWRRLSVGQPMGPLL